MEKKNTSLAALLGCLVALSLVANVYQYQLSQTKVPAGLEVARAEAQAEAQAIEDKARSEDELRLEFLNLWFADTDFFHPNKWYGVQTLQNPLDVWITQEVITEVKPDVIVEVGTRFGGSSLLWAGILENLNPEGRIITIDIEDRRVEEAINHPLAKERVDFILGDSIAPETIAEVTRRVEGKSVLVILDSLHTETHVAAELKGYGPLVPPGSYVIVQDTGGHLQPDGWPWKACVDLAESDPNWTIDRSRERFYISNNQFGYLKRNP